MDPKRSHPTPQPDANLLLRLSSPEDDLAWFQFSHQYDTFILRICRQSGLQAADADDVRQVVLWNLRRAMRTFRLDPARGHFRSYLARIVRSAIFKLRTSRETRTVELNAAISATEPGDMVSEREWRDHRVQEIMERLGRELRGRSCSVFKALLAGEEQSEIASRLGLSTDAVKKIRYRTMKKVRSYLHDDRIVLDRVSSRNVMSRIQSFATRGA